MPDIFRLDFKVRDYECDLQGIVNNAVYQGYLEHARHEFLLSKNLNFAQLSREGLDLVVTRAELDYTCSLTSGDAFYVLSSMHMKDRIRFIFHQQIYRQDDRLCVKAIITGTGITKAGHPSMPKDLVAQLLSS